MYQSVFSSYCKALKTINLYEQKNLLWLMLIEVAAHGHMTPEGIKEQCQKLFVSLSGSKKGRGSNWYPTIPLRAHLQ